MEPFWDLKIGKYVEYPTHACIQWIPYKLRAAFSGKYGRLNFLAYGLCNPPIHKHSYGLRYT